MADAAVWGLQREGGCRGVGLAWRRVISQIAFLPQSYSVIIATPSPPQKNKTTAKKKEPRTPQQSFDSHVNSSQHHLRLSDYHSKPLPNNILSNYEAQSHASETRSKTLSTCLFMLMHLLIYTFMTAPQTLWQTGGQTWLLSWYAAYFHTPTLLNWLNWCHLVFLRKQTFSEWKCQSRAGIH